ncbi:MAG: cobalamin-dependent protein [Pseudomonadota bacterium]
MTEFSKVQPKSTPADFQNHLSAGPTRSEMAPQNPAADLLRTIESEILPRLVLVHSNDQSRPTARVGSLPIQPETLDAFVTVMIDESGTSGREMVEDLVRSGVAPEAIYLDLLAPAARQMGELWESDIRNFTDVTVGLCRLHEVLRHNALSPRHGQIFPAPETPSILLSTACGDQHVFGVIIVSEFFRKEGWQVTCEPGASTEELARIARLHNFDVIGLSIACSVGRTDLIEMIEHMRAMSRNPDVKIILGGALVERDPTIALKVGADSSLVDAAQAPTAAMRLLADSRVGC